MVKQRINFWFKLAIASIVILIALFFIIGYTLNFLKDLDYFKIKDIVVSKGQEGFDFSELRGRNIFEIDLKKESKHILELYPSYKRVSLAKILPNRLFIGFRERKPLAYVKLYRYFGVDRDLVLFDLPLELKDEDLPVITGLETKIFGAKSGKRYNIKELTVAVNIIKEAQMNSLSTKFIIKKIDAGNSTNTSFFIQLADYPETAIAAGEGILEIKIGEDDIAQRLGVLSDLLTQLKSDSGSIKYIDLRFKEPLVKFK